MDTSGKSGTIKAVFSDTTPLGMEVKAFKAPSTEELARDYLWRVHNAVPRRGNVGIFDRSHYEDVLVVRVREFAPLDEVEKRYEQINAFEKHLSENGTVVLKFMLNVGYEEQGIRLKERLEEQHKLWKFNPVDLDDRARWPEFMAAYQLAVQRCSTRHAPWYIIPSDSRTRRNAAIARVVRGALEGMNLKWKDPGLKPESFDFG
jgi:PPK2 family polyphosphate:nucleotide phosphotransferase